MRDCGRSTSAAAESRGRSEARYRAAMRPTIPALLTVFFAAVGLRAQQASQAEGATATLIPVTNWVFQCEPIRCTLQATAPDSAVWVRPLHSHSSDPLSPLQVERRQGDEDRWVAVPPPPRPRAHPSRYLTAPSGRLVEARQSCQFEVELWDSALLAEPGTIRVRCRLETTEATANLKEAAWRELATPWVQFEIRAHEGNTAFLMGKENTARLAGLDELGEALNATFTTMQNQGPTNLGPAGRTASRFERFGPLATSLVADPKVSWRLRARARLVLGYDAVAQALRAKGDAREQALLAARTHLTATELVASPPSGGLDPLPSGGLLVLQQFLLAIADDLEGQGDAKAVHADLCKRHPWFAHAWRMEAIDLLLLRR